MIPVVSAGADDDQVFALGLFAVDRPLAGELQQGLAVDAGVLLLPGGCVRGDFSVILWVSARQATRHPKLGHDQVENRGYCSTFAPGFDIANRNTPLEGCPAAEVIKTDLKYIVILVDQTQCRSQLFFVEAVLEFQVPFAGVLLCPAIAYSAFWHPRAR